MKPFIRFRGVAAIATIALPLAVAGCTVVRNTTDMAPDIDRRFPLQLSSSTKTQTLDLGATQTSLTRAQRAQLSGFVRGYLRSGRGPMDIVVAGRNKGDALALVRGAMVQQALLKEGMMRQELRVRIADVGGGSKGPVVLSFKAYRVNVRDCGDVSAAHTFNPRNRSYSNFGCAIQSNTAAMISNPGDLVSSRPEEATDSRRRGTFVNKYKSGN